MALVDPYQIISKARGLVGLSTRGGFSGSGGISSQLDNYDFSWGEAPTYNFNTMTIVPPDFQVNYGSPQPFTNPSGLPVPAIDGSPLEPAFAAVDFVGRLGAFPILTPPSYEDATVISEVPSATIDAPPTDYPVEGFLTVPTPPSFSADIPSITLGDRLDVLNRTIDSFDALQLPLFNEALPVPHELELVFVDAPTWTDYTDDQEIIARIEATLFDGGLLSFEVQKAIFDELLELVDREKYTAENAVFTEQAAKGFSLPNPALNNALLDISHTVRMKATESNRKVRDEAAKRALEGSSTAFSTRLGLEAAHIQLYKAYVGDVLKVQKVNVQMANTLLRTTIDIFNKKVEMIRLVLRTYREYLSAMDKQNSTVEAQARAINALTDAYNAYVGMFEAQSDVSQAAARLEALKVDLATLPIEAFSSQLQAVLANVSIAKQNIDAFTTAVKAYSDSVDATLGEWDAYSSGVNAAISGVSVVEANYDAASRYAGAEADRVEAYVSSLGSELQGIEAGLSEYKEYSQAQREFMAAATYKLTALGSSIEDYSRAVREASGYVTVWNRAEAERVGALNNVSLALSDQNLRQQLLDAAAGAAQARIDAGWLAAQAQAASSFAQSALGIVNTNISLDGNARITGGTSEQADTSFRAAANRSWRYSKSESVSA